MASRSSDVARCLGLLVSIKTALVLDPALYTSVNVTRQIGRLNNASRLLKNHLSDLPPVAEDALDD